ncbi:divergent polysaccharide deacetylase family protein [bacterium]|nr:MAG: divergent polysaccharide deacetylase family protein [bacterium]
MARNRRHIVTIIVLSLLVVIEGLFILYLSRRPFKRPPGAVILPKPKIAIVLDDWGYNLHNLKIAEEIKQPLTMSVLPNLDYSRTVCEELHKRGFEIILHLPMEPHEKINLEKNTIMVSMDQDTIRNVINSDLTNVLYASGVSNHMGSAATENSATMTVVFKELKKKKLYFLDSFVSSHSVCHNLARKIKLRFARRDIFLDNQENASYIKNQISKLKSKAKIYGQAIGIGHDHKVTLEVLKEVLPKLEKEGYQFVYLSELVR